MSEMRKNNMRKNLKTNEKHNQPSGHRSNSVKCMYEAYVWYCISFCLSGFFSAVKNCDKKEC